MTTAASVPLGPENSLEMVVFRAAGHRCAIEARLVRGSRLPSSDRETATIASIESRLGLEDPSEKPRLILELRTPPGTSVAVRSEVEVRRLPHAILHPLPPLVAARTRLLGLKGLALEPDGLTLLVGL